MSSPAPTRAKRPRIFYGWYILGLSSVAGFFAGATSLAFFGVFVKPIEDEMGWSRTAIATAITVATFATGALATLFGKLADRHGPRLLMTMGALLYVVGYGGMGLVTQVWHLFLAYLVARAASLHLLSGVVPRTAAINWFRVRRGRAVGIQTMSMALGGAALAALSGVLLERGMDWRTVLLLFAAVAAVLLVVPLPLVMRRQPEDMGLLPDGLDAPAEAAPAGHEGHGRHGGHLRRGAPSDTEPSWTLGQAMGTRALWLVTMGMLLGTWASGGIAFHMPAYYIDTGLGPGVAAAAASLFLLSGALSSTAWGFLAERFSEQRLVLIATATGIALTVYVRFVSEPIGGLLFAALFGATIRGETALLMMLLAGYFGRRHFGAISGFASQFTFYGLAMGPIVFSLMFDITGSYDGVFYTATGMLSVAFAALALARKPAARSVAVHQTTT